MPAVFAAGEKVSNLSELELNVTRKNMEVTTNRGEPLTTDLIICCTGLRVNSAAYASSFRVFTQTHTYRDTLALTQCRKSVVQFHVIMLFQKVNIYYILNSN